MRRIRRKRTKKQKFATIVKRWKHPLLAIATMLAILIFHLHIWTPSALAQSTASVNKSFSPGTINPGAVSTLTVAFYNSNTIPITNGAITDNLPAGMTVATPANASTTCVGGTVTGTPGATSVSIANATVPGKVGSTLGSCSFSVSVTTTVQGNSVNTILANKFTNTQNQTNLTPASATLQVNTMNAPSISKTLSPNTIFAGDTSTLTITITNQDLNIDLTQVGITDTLPTNVTIAGTGSTTCTGGTVSTTTNSVTLSNGTVTKNSNCTVTVPITSTVTGSYTNTIPASSITSQQGVTNASSASVNLSVQQAIVNVAKSFSPTTPYINQPSILTVTLTNPTFTKNYTGVGVTDTLPANLTVAGAPATTCGGTVSNTATSVTLSGGTINANNGTANCTITVPVTSTTAGAYTNTIGANAVTTTSGVTTSTAASANVTFNPLQVTVAKSFSPATINTGGTTTTSQITITLTNPTTTNFTGLGVTDNLPTGLTVAATPGLSTTCTGGTVSNTSTSVTLSGASLNASASCTVKVNVTSTIGGTYANTIGAGTVTTNQGATNSGTTTNLTVRGFVVSKAFSPTSVAIGTASTLTITLQNYTTTALTGVTVTDPLPTNVTVANPPNATTTCSGGTVTQTSGAALVGGETSFKLSGGSISAISGTTPGSCTVSIQVVPSTTGGKTNTIPIANITNNQGISVPSVVSANLTGVTSTLSVTKTFTPTTVNVGQSTQLNIRINNPGSSGNVTGMSITDTLPTNVVIANPPTASTTCTSGTVTATSGSSTVSLSGASLTQGIACNVLVNVVATTVGTGTYTNTIPVSALVTNEGRTNTTAGSATLTVVGATVSKSFAPSTIAPNGRSVLAVTITNYQPTPLTNVKVVDNLPTTAPAIKIASAPTNASTTCTNGTVTATPVTGTSVTLTGATIPAAVGGVPGICTFQVEVTGTTSSGSNTNTIPAGTTYFSSNEGVTTSAAASATFNFSPLSINVDKSFNPLTVNGGSSSTLTVTLNNPTAQNYIGVNFTDTMPSGMEIASVPNASTTCTGGTVTATPGANNFSLSGGQIPANTTCTVQLYVTSVITGNVTNTIPAGGVTSFQGASNTSAASATLTNLPGAGLSKSFTPPIVGVGNISTLSVKILNANSFPLTNLSITDNLPTGVTVAATPNTATTCSSGTVSTTSTSVSLSGGTVAANSTCTVSVDVTATALNTYTNTIPAGNLGNNEAITNGNPATATLMVVNLPTVSKSFSPTTIQSNSTSTLTIQLGNNNTNPITLTAIFTDTLPSGVTVATTPNVSGTCTTANVTATAGGNTISYANGSTIPTNGCTIAVNVTSSTATTYTNTIPAGALQTSLGNNANPASASLTVSLPPQVLLVKRITRINSTDITGFVTGTTNDQDALWPNPNTTYLRGVIDGGKINPQDTIEYTIYFLVKTAPAQNFSICDLVPDNTTFTFDSFNGLTPTDGGTPGADSGIALALSSSTLPTAPTFYLSNIADADRGVFFRAGATPSTTCSATNTNGAVVVNVVTGSTTLPNATASGIPPNSYGFIRFRASVN